MSWRIVVIRERAKLDLQLGYMVVRRETVQKIHLSEISIVMIENTAVSLTAALLAELVKQKIKVVFCDAKRNPAAELLPYYGAFDTSAKIRQQIGWTEENKGNVWTAIVRNKICNQAGMLAVCQKKEFELLLGYIDELKFADESNREGHAAKVYFNALFGKGFSRADTNSINAALNYGYAMLLSMCNREIVSNGYITQLGIHHCNVFDDFNFGSDLMEIFRPFIDAKVYEMWQCDKLEIFETAEKTEILSTLNREVKVSGKNYTLNYAVKLYCKGIFAALNDEDVSLFTPCYFEG